MKRVIFLLAIILILIPGCKKDLPTGPSLPEPSEPILVGVKEIRITVFIDLTDEGLIPFLNPIYSYHEILLEIYRGSWSQPIDIYEYVTETGMVIKEFSKYFGTSPGWQVMTNENKTINTRYFVARIPPTEQKKIRWRFQIAIELNDSQYKVKIWAGGSGAFSENNSGLKWYMTTQTKMERLGIVRT